MAEPIIKESRIKFPKGKQRLFLKGILWEFNLSRPGLSKIFDINIRTLSDWLQEKSTLNYGSFSNLRAKYAVSLPREVRILNRFWYTKKGAKLGALIRNKLYGNPGTAAGRRKGGLVSMAKFKANPHLAYKLGIIVRKKIKYPKKSLEFAELIGVILGDGNLTDYQLRITLNRITDKKYGIFVRGLVRKLFGLTPKTIFPNDSAAFDIVVYSKNLTDFLIRKGLVKGNKVKNNVDLPLWIKEKRILRLRCLRGLMDTDGSFYQYRHIVKNRSYRNYALCFTNRSANLIKSAYGILKKEKLKPSKTSERVYLYRKRDIARYFKIIGSNNPKHIVKYMDLKIC